MKTILQIAAGIVVLSSTAAVAQAPQIPDRCVFGDPCEAFAKFEYLSEDPDILAWARSGLQRIENATCIGLALAPGQHTIELKDDLPGTRVGQTVGGTWDATHVEVVKQSPNATGATLVHEFLHVLGRTNNHAATGVSASPRTTNWITAPDLELVCQNLPCRCMRPER